MGSSARKKKEKKKDFQKPKLRVGKAKPKADNFTDTSFKAKSIVVNQQSLTTSAPSSISQLSHYLSLASSSKSDTQRRDALSYLTTQFASQPVASPLPLPTAIVLPKLLPLILDGSSSVRAQLLRFLHQLPPHEIGDKSESILLYTRAGLTHLASEIRVDALALLELLLKAASYDVVSCPGGWVKTLKTFISMMGWVGSSGVEARKWTSASRASFGKVGKAFPRQLLVFAQFLKIGLGSEGGEGAVGANESLVSGTGVTHFLIMDMRRNMIPTRSNAYAHLNLFGGVRDEEGEMYIDREDRQRVFHKYFKGAVDIGVENARKEGGEVGRAAAVLAKVLQEGMEDYDIGNDTP